MGFTECELKNSFMWILLISANVDKGGGGKTLIHKMWIIARFFNPSLTQVQCSGWKAMTYLQLIRLEWKSLNFCSKYPVFKFLLELEDISHIWKQFLQMKSGCTLHYTNWNEFLKPINNSRCLALLDLVFILVLFIFSFIYSLQISYIN